MIEAIFSFIAEKAPVLAVFFIGCVIGGCAVRLFFWVRAISKKVRNLPCKKHSEKIVSISKWVMNMDKTMIKELSFGMSPLQLTPVGEEFLFNSGGKKCIDENLDFFVSELASKAPPTPFDVESEAQNLVLDSFSLPMFYPIKNFLYFNPKIKIGSQDAEPSVFTVSYVMGLYLRDIYLEKYPELLPEMEAATV